MKWPYKIQLNSPNK